MADLTAQSFQPQQYGQLATQPPISPLQLPEQIAKRAAGDFGGDVTSQVYEERLGLAREQNKMIQEALQRQFATQLEQAQEQARQLAGRQKAGLARVGALGTTSAGVVAQTEFERSLGKDIEGLRTEQAGQLAQTRVAGQEQELKVIEAKYGEQGRRQAEAIVQQLEVQKENAKIQTMNSEMNLAVAKFNEEARLQGIEQARRSAETAGFVVTNDGNLVPTFAKEQEVNKKVEQDRRFQLDEAMFRSQQQFQQQQIALQAAGLTGELEGVKTLAAKNLELEALRLGEQVKQFEREQGFKEVATTRELDMGERAQSFSEAIKTAESMIQARLADNTIKKTDADILMESLSSARQEKLTRQQLREGDVNIALKIADDLRQEKILPVQMDKIKAETARLGAETEKTKAETKKIGQLLKAAPTLKVIGDQYGYVTTNENGEPIFKATGNVAASPNEKATLMKAFNEMIKSVNFDIESAGGLYAASGGTVSGFVNSLEQKGFSVVGDEIKKVGTFYDDAPIGKVIKDSKGNIIDVTTP